jgi:hypothetical protein
MFDLFKSGPFNDPELGELRRSRGAWRGTVRLDGRAVPLVIAGPRKAPDPDALRLARTVTAAYPAWKLAIAAALLEHYAPYAEAVSEGEEQAPEGGLPAIAGPDGVWPHTSAQFVHVHPLDRRLGVEIGYQVAWDEEHTLAAQVRDGQVIGLNGSVLAP